MTDCYRILGVSPHASQDEIRAAYIAKMKVLHPDAAVSGSEKAAGASEITAAYWHLRDKDRRSEHDRRVFASTALAAANRLPPLPRRRLLPTINRRPPPVRPKERTSRVLKGAAAGIVMLALAAPAALFWVAHFNPIVSARAHAGAPPVVWAPAVRRPLDGMMRAAAADDFAAVIRDFGWDGARNYSRRCLAELSARASLTMLDYCIAFDDAAANWERPKSGAVSKAEFFSDDQRSGTYRETALSMREPAVRQAMLQEANFFAGGGEAAAPLSLSISDTFPL
jgi:curved DNA-binding protein CbpA